MNLMNNSNLPRSLTSRGTLLSAWWSWWRRWRRRRRKRRRSSASSAAPSAPLCPQWPGEVVLPWWWWCQGGASDCGCTRTEMWNDSWEPVADKAHLAAACCVEQLCVVLSRLQQIRGTGGDGGQSSPSSRYTHTDTANILQCNQISPRRMQQMSMLRSPCPRCVSW